MSLKPVLKQQWRRLKHMYGECLNCPCFIKIIEFKHYWSIQNFHAIFAKVDKTLKTARMFSNREFILKKVFHSNVVKAKKNWNWKRIWLKFFISQSFWYSKHATVKNNTENTFKKLSKPNDLFLKPNGSAGFSRTAPVFHIEAYREQKALQRYHVIRSRWAKNGSKMNCLKNSRKNWHPRVQGRPLKVQ